MRGTTPKHTITLDTTLTGAQLVQVTYAQKGKKIMQKRDSELTISGKTITVELSEEESYKFYEGAVDVQVRAVLSDDTVVKSNIMHLYADESLDTAVLSWEV